jgi:aldose 1-epimerase
MRPLSPEARQQGDIGGVSMFPMAPYANRIAGNKFTFGGRVWRFSANSRPEELNLHGTAWKSVWTVESWRATEAILVLDHIAPEEPYSYGVTQHFLLTPQGFVVTISLINRGLLAMPFGFGHHPFFQRDPDVTVAFRAAQFWMEGPDGVATDPIAMPPELDFAVARTLPATWRNNDYGGWSGIAEIRFPSRRFGLRIAADPIFGHLMLYADPYKPYFCLEPQTNAVGAFNKIGQGYEADLGVIVLQPGTSAEGSISFVPFAL